MPYGGLAIPMWNVLTPAHVNLAGSATWSTVVQPFVVMPTSEDSYVLGVFRLPDTYLADSDIQVVANAYKNAAGTQAVTMEFGYFTVAAGAAAPVAATSYTTLGALTATVAFSSTTKQLASYTGTIPGTGLVEDTIVVVKAGRSGNSTVDAYGDSVVLADLVLRIKQDDMGEPVV
jgi:hypothetical protein